MIREILDIVKKQVCFGYIQFDIYPHLGFKQYFQHFNWQKIVT